MTSLGIRSLVNCTLRNVPAMLAANVRASSVLPIPGMPSTSMCPPAINAQSTGSTTSCGTLTTRVRFVSSRSRAVRACVCAGAATGSPECSSAHPAPLVGHIDDRAVALA